MVFIFIVVMRNITRLARQRHKEFKMLSRIIFIICFLLIGLNAGAVEVYSPLDTLKVPVILSNGYYANIDTLRYYIFSDPTEGVLGNYLAFGDVTIDGGVNSIDTTMAVEWIIPAGTGNGIYWMAINMVYDATKQNIKMESFRVGPVPSTTQNTYGYYIDQDDCGGSVEIGGVPLNDARIIARRVGVSENFSETRTDASGDFTIYVPYYTSGYMIIVAKQGVYFPECGPIVPTAF